MSEQYVSIIKIDTLWFFADFTSSINGWNVRRLKSAGTDYERAKTRAVSSAQSRNLPFIELDFSPEINKEIIVGLKKHCAYKKAVRQHAKLVKAQNQQASNSEQCQPLHETVDVCNELPQATEEVTDIAILSISEHAAYPEGALSCVAYFDGSSRDGVTAAAVIIDLPEGKSITATEFNPTLCSSSEVEYAAAILALRTSLEQGLNSLILKGDCLEVITYLRAGTTRSVKGKLLDLHDSALSLISQFECVQLEWIPRKQNHRAHNVAKAAVAKESKLKSKNSKTKTKSQNSNQKTKSKNSNQKTKSQNSNQKTKSQNLKQKTKFQNLETKKKKAIPYQRASQSLQCLSLPTLPASPQLATQINRMVELGSKARIADYETLKSGWDEFSKLRLPTLTAMVPDVVVEAIARHMSQIDEKDLAKLYRWILRGLPAFMAVRKLEVDAETAKSVVKALRRFRYE